MTSKNLSSLLKDIPYTALRSNNIEVSGIAYASDKVVPGDLFFCVVGARFDGHDFAEKAVENGAAALVVERFLLVDIPQFKVRDTRSALASASAAFFDYPSDSLDIIGITGTNGKTTTSYLCEWIAQKAGKKTGLIGTVETRIADARFHAVHTTPESYDLQALLARMVEAGVDTVAMEVSSHAIDLGRIEGIQFCVAAFSNLTQDHLDYHHDMEEYFEVKSRLFIESCADAFAICIDDEYGSRLVGLLEDMPRPLMTCGFSELADVHPLEGSSICYHSGSTDCIFATPAGVCELHLPFVGRFNVQNALLATTIGLLCGIDLETIAAALESAPQVPGRLERVCGCEGRGFSVLVDYAHTPDAIMKAVDVVKQVTPGKVICVFGCGGDRDKTKRPLMGTAALRADIAVVTSDNPRGEDPTAIIADILVGMEEGKQRTVVIRDRREAIHHALQLAQEGDCVLIAGKGHEDYQLIGNDVVSFDDRIVAVEEFETL